MVRGAHQMPLTHQFTCDLLSMFVSVSFCCTLFLKVPCVRMKTPSLPKVEMIELTFEKLYACVL